LEPIVKHYAISQPFSHLVTYYATSRNLLLKVSESNIF
jgi:hypothetical protein